MPITKTSFVTPELLQAVIIDKPDKAMIPNKIFFFIQMIPPKKERIASLDAILFKFVRYHIDSASR